MVHIIRPATALVFLNLDPVPHRLVRCSPCGDSARVAADTGAST